jgi:hypothetical protein
MRRWMSALLVGVLVAVLWPRVASASTLFAPQSIDLSAQLFARCFGEPTDDAQATFTASLTDIALRFTPTVLHVVNVASTASKLELPLPSRHISLADPSYSPPQLAGESLSQVAAQFSVPAVGYYESALPLPTDAPATHHFDIADFESGAAQIDAGTNDASVKVPLRVGHVQFAPHAEAQAASAPQTTLGDTTLGAGTTFDIRAGKRSLGLDLTSQLEHVTLNAPEFSATGSSSQLATGLTGDNLPVFVPAYADVSAKTLSTGVSVPVTRALTASVQYDTQHLLGTYSSSGSLGLDANNTIYGAQLTFQLPKSTSAISLGMRQYRYQDNIVPSNALTTTNTNVNFTIKF